MELGATMELGDGRGSQLEEEDTPYIVEGQIQPLSTNPACAAWYYRARGTVLPQGRAVLPQGPAVLPPEQHRPGQLNRTEEEGSRTACAVLPHHRAVLPRGREVPENELART